jgi:hypothetical protein
MKKWLTKVDFLEVALAIALGLLVIATRTIWQFGPNIELISSLVVFSAVFYKQKWLRFVAPISVIIISDLVIGNSAIFLFTWSAFIVGLLMSLLLRRIKQKSTKDAILSPIEFVGSGIVNVLFFYLWTNLGVVLVSGMYPLSIFGLSQSYINALPFLGNQLLSVAIGGVVFYSLYRSLSYLRDSKLSSISELKLVAQAK